MDCLHSTIYFTNEIKMKSSVSVGNTLNPKLLPVVCGSVLHGSSCRQHVGVFVWMGGLCSVLWLLLMCRKAWYKSRLFYVDNINPKTSLLCFPFTWTAALQDKNQFKAPACFTPMTSRCWKFNIHKYKHTRTNTHPPWGTGLIIKTTYSATYTCSGWVCIYVPMRRAPAKTTRKWVVTANKHGPTSPVALSLLCLDRNAYFLTAFPHSAVLCGNAVSKSFS